MNTAWPAAGQETAPGDLRAEAAAALEGTIAIPLTQLGFIAASGADVEVFLQGQLSNDVRNVGAARAQLSSFNSPKGRMLAVLTLFRDGDAILLEVHRSVLEPVLKRLRMYVLRSKVKLEDASSSLAGIGVSGLQAAHALQGAGLPVPAAPFEVLRAGPLAVTRRLGERSRFTVHGPADAVKAAWPRLAAGARPAGIAAWRLLDIEAGVPTIYAETQDRFVAQMCNLDELGGISFTKGCYTGQEVVARVHYLGSVKRRMVKTHLPGTAAAPGTRIDAAAGGGLAGELVDAAPSPDGGSAALVVAQAG